MGNCSLLDKFPNIYACFLPYRISDHCPMLVHLPGKKAFKVRPFKFANVLTLSSELRSVVESVWGTQILGYHMFRLSQKG